MLFSVRMLKKFLKDVLILVVGRQVEEMADLLYSDKHVNEFLIAKRLGITINQTRNILYKISDKGLVSSIRKKDKRKGWYTYFWKIEVLKALEFLKSYVLKRIEQIQSQLRSRQSRQFYLCEKCNLEFSEENALVYDFTCRECGNVFAVKDNSKVIRDFKKDLLRLGNELKLINVEIEKENSKLDKKKEREIKKKIKEKKDNKKSKKVVKVVKKKVVKVVKEPKKKILKKRVYLGLAGLKKKIKSKKISKSKKREANPKMVKLKKKGKR